MSTLTERQGPKHIKQWTAIINTIPKEAISSGDMVITRSEILRVDEVPAPAGTQDKYLIGVPEQRLLKMPAAQKLRDSFDLTASHHTTELVLCRTVDDPGNIRVPDGQTRLLALLLGKDPGPKTFRFVMYDKVTSKQMRALFEFYAFRRDMSTQDKLALYRLESPAYQYAQTPEEQSNPVFRVVLDRGSNRNGIPPRVTWMEMLVGWMLGMSGNGVPSALELQWDGRRCSSSGFNTDLVIRLFISSKALTAYKDTERLMAAVQMVAHLSKPVLDGSPEAKGLRLSDVGKQLARMMVTFEKDKTNAVWRAVMHNPNRRVQGLFWSAPMFRILFCLVKDNGWDTVYRRLPWLMKIQGNLETREAYTNATAPLLRDQIEFTLNYNTRGIRLKFPGLPPLPMKGHKTETSV